MYQSFKETADGSRGPERLAQLRTEMSAQGLDAFLVPRADVHQGEYVADCDTRLAWLTGFTGSAGFCAALKDVAGVFIDSRYHVQVRAQVAEVFTPVHWPDTTLAEWLKSNLKEGLVGFDPWLHTVREVEALSQAFAGGAITLQPTDNLIDALWTDRPTPPNGPASTYPEALAGRSMADKCSDLAQRLTQDGHKAAVLTLPDSICWMLNIRGSDIPKVPVLHCFAILHDTGQVDLFADAAKLSALDLGAFVSIQDPSFFSAALQGLTGPVRIDPNSAPEAVRAALQGADVEIALVDDPCAIPKACKTDAEIEGSRAAHLRDGAAMCEFLAWLDGQEPESLSEIDVVTALEGFRRATNALRDISFDTICGSGPNGAIVHYRVTEATNRKLKKGDVLLVDSGGQYLDGTTDITRTIALGEVGQDPKEAFTRVLKGMIGVSMLRWPAGLAGRDLDMIARAALWQAGQDYGHGTGHGVGAYLSVHEGPQRLARTGTVPFQPGMILSNEPGFYREGAFGIRIENLIAVTPAPALPGATVAELLEFETLTFVPIDRRMIVVGMLTGPERDWLNAYHGEVLARIGPRLGKEAKLWLDAACAAL